MNILIDLIPVQSYKGLDYHGGGEYLKKVLGKIVDSRKDNIYYVISKNLILKENVLSEIQPDKILIKEENLKKK